MLAPPGYAKMVSTPSRSRQATRISLPYDEDRMDLAITAMGKQVNASVEVGDSAVTVEVNLPGALKLFEGLVRGAVEANGRKLLK